nr:MAG TPA: hypothetical protein [Caudoviricetes sp.]DAZ82828.1 MAG TPA: hypothetical protein [Caudoviricetes sp.]
MQLRVIRLRQMVFWQIHKNLTNNERMIRR